jgi:hypothetical protein
MDTDIKEMCTVIWIVLEILNLAKNLVNMKQVPNVPELL